MTEQEFDVTLAIEAVRAGLEQVEACQEILDIEVNDATLIYHLGDGESFFISVSAAEITISSCFEGYDEEIIKCSPKEFVDELDFIIARLLQDIDGIDRGLQEHELSLTGQEGQQTDDVERHLMDVLGIEKTEDGELKAKQFESTDEWAGTSWAYEDESEKDWEHWS
jgi:hypothetical protein